MAWVKIPKEHHPVFQAALPTDKRVSTMRMFGGTAGIVNGHMFSGTFGKSFIVKLGDADREEALQLDGAELFDPMGNGRIMKDTVFMPEATFGEDAELRAWLRRSFEFALTLPPKPKKGTKQKAPAKKSAAKKPAAKKLAKKPAAKKRTAKRR
jgi:TfoX/Sxy family transcriptional regulator of competence genes